MISSDNVRKYKQASTSNRTLKELKNSTNKIVGFAATQSNTLLLLSLSSSKTIYEFTQSADLAPLSYSFEISQSHGGSGQAKVAVQGELVGSTTGVTTCACIYQHSGGVSTLLTLTQTTPSTSTTTTSTTTPTTPTTPTGPTPSPPGRLLQTPAYAYTSTIKQY